MSIEKCKFLEHRDNYARLRDKLSTLADETEYDVFVPIAYSRGDNFEYTTGGLTGRSKTKSNGKNNQDLPLAFMPGKLVHTNELLVHLGDNWFVERSAKQSVEIANRKIVKCNELLERLEKNEAQIAEWLKKLDEMKSDRDNLVEIHEEFNEEEEKRWREKHRENVRKQKEKERSEREALRKEELKIGKLDEKEEAELESNFALLSTVTERVENEQTQQANKTDPQRPSKPISKFKQQMINKRK